MSTVPAVIVKKGGFLSALCHGLFGFLTVAVVCASGIGVYALHVADSKLDGVFTLTRDAVAGLPEWREKLPPLLGELLNDRRAPEYRDQVEIRVSATPAPGRRDREVALIEVTNNGPETISLLALNVAFEDEAGVPVRETRTYVATPLAADEDDWRGLLFPHSTRRVAVSCCGDMRGLRPSAQIVDLRVWNGPRPPEDAQPADDTDPADRSESARDA